MRLLPILLLLLLSCGAASAQQSMPVAQDCVIEGIAAGPKGSTVSVFSTEDYITGTQSLLAETTVGDSGRFSVKVELEKTSYLTLENNKTKGSLFAEPGHTHRVAFPDRDSLHMVSQEIAYPVELMIYSKDSTEMNSLVIDYNQRFNQFWAANYQYFLYKESIHRLDSFHVAMRKHYANVKNPAFLPWMDFTLASLEDATFHSDKKLAADYLVYKVVSEDKKESYHGHRPIFYDNGPYMEFFNSFFDNYMYKYSIKREGQNISAAINVKGSYDALMEAMKPLRWLDNDTLRELVMLKGLFECYNNPAFEGRNIISIAQQVSTQSKVPEHRRIAGNIVAFYTKLKEGSAAPGFTGIDRKGQPVTLENFKGKFVLLSFYASWNSHAVSEMKVLPDLQKKYGKKIAFVSVSLDQDTGAYRKFLKENPKFNWTMLHYNFNEQLKEDYQLLALPAFFIIDPEGKLWASPADPPSGRLEYDLYKIANPKRR